MSIRNWLRGVRGVKAALDGQASLRKFVLDTRKEQEAASRDLEKRREQLFAIQEQWSKAFSDTQKAMDRLQEATKAADEALRAAQGALRTANDVVIPGLVSANETFVAAWDAQSASMRMRQAAMQAEDKEG